MTTYQDISIHMVEIRHNGPTIQYKVDALDDYVLFNVQDAAGKTHGGSEQAKHLNTYFRTIGLEGVEARAATIALPPVTLEALFNDPSKDNEVDISTVCSNYVLMAAARTAGAIGTIFTSEDIGQFLEESENGDYAALSDDEKREFIGDYWKVFVRNIDDQMTLVGNRYIEGKVDDELDNCLQEFREKRPTAPGM